MNAILLPIEVLIFAALACLASRRPSPSIALLWIAGFVGAVIAMSCANRIVGGSFDFLSPTLAVLSALTPAGSKDAYYAPWSGWVPIASWMILPGIITIASVAFVIARTKYILEHFRRTDASPEFGTEANLLIFATAYILTICGFGLMQVYHWDMLSLFFRANTLWPFAFLIVGGLLALSLSQASPRFQLRLAISAAIVCLAPWLLGAIGAIHAPFPWAVLPYQVMLRPAIMLYGDLSEAIWTLAGAALLIGAWLLPFRIFL